MTPQGAGPGPRPDPSDLDGEEEEGRMGGQGQEGAGPRAHVLGSSFSTLRAEHTCCEK